jgi:hypothetical protein
MNSGCAAIFGPVGVGEADGTIEGAGDACPSAGDTSGAGDTLGDGDAASVAVSAMIARSGTDASLHAG